MIALNLDNLYDKNCRLMLGKENTEKSFKDDFSFLIQKNINNNTIDDIIKIILIIMEIKDKNYILKHKITKLPGLFINPSYNYIYLYKRKNNKGFLGVKTIKDKQQNELVKIYDLKQEREVYIFENDCEYFYTLLKKRKPRLVLSDPIPKEIKGKLMKKEN